jgi:FkbM family methyltransferase
MNALKKLAARLPLLWQQELKRLRNRREIERGIFVTTEPEFDILGQLVSPGDWVVDVGANIGHYTKRLSDLVGRDGRVIAVEPVPDTFALLAANAALFQFRNVTLLNVAASGETGLVGMEIPAFETGLSNYYQATVTERATGLEVMTVALDSLAIRHRVRLIKIDAEGHEPAVLRGLSKLLARDHPTLIVETGSPDTDKALGEMGYRTERLPGSPNLLCR